MQTRAAIPGAAVLMARDTSDWAGMNHNVGW